MAMPVLAQAQTASSKSIAFDIQSQSLESALIQFSRQSGLNVIWGSTSFEPRNVAALKGRYSVEDVLAQLLEGSGLTFRLVEPHSVAITALPKPAKPKPKIKRKAKTPASAVEEVFVTASRRNDQLSELPVAISVLRDGFASETGNSQLEDQTHLVPGLEIVNDGVQSAVLVQLRGVATTNITEIADGPVAIYVDGVYSPRSQAFAALMHDIDRVEVLRGPQGTLFGRNSLAGSILVHSNRPELDEVYGSIELGSGNYGANNQRLMVNVPLSDNLATRFSYAREYHDATIDVIDSYAGLGQHYPANDNEVTPFEQSLDLGQQGLDIADRQSLRWSMNWQASDDSQLYTVYEHYTDQGVSGSELDPTLVERGQRAVVLDTAPFLDLVNDSLKLEFTQQLPKQFELNYYGGWAKMSRRQAYDADLGRDGGFEAQRTHSSSFSFDSHELLLKSPQGRTVEGLLGFYFSRENNQIVFSVDQQNPGGDHVPTLAPNWVSESQGAGVAYAIQPERRVRSSGVFGHSSIRFSDTSKLTFGLRHTIEEKSDQNGRRIVCSQPSVNGPYQTPTAIAAAGPSIDQIYADAGASAAIAEGRFYDNGSNIGITDQPCWVNKMNDVQARWNNTSGSISLDIDVNDNTLLYSAIATGFKSGHIQDAGNVAAPETVTNYELGIKHEVASAYRLNMAAFYADYRNLQYSNEDRFDNNGDGIQDAGGSTIVRNASAAIVKGLELEWLWQQREQQVLRVVAAFTDAEYRDFQIPDTLYGDVFNPFVDASQNTNNDPVDLSGNKPPRTPVWRLTAQYDYQFSGLLRDLNATLTAVFSDKYFLDIYNRDTVEAGVFEQLPNGGSNLGVQQPFSRFDLALRYQRQSAPWSIGGYIKNMTDEAIKLSSGNAITEAGFVANYAPPRTYGLSLRYEF